MAGFFKKKAAKPAPAPPPFFPEEPLRLMSDRVTFMVGLTTRHAIEIRLGPAVEYPAPGWKTWVTAGTRNEVWVLSAIYRGQILIGIEHYLSKAESLPRHTPPANGVFRLFPGEIGLGNRISALTDHWRSAGGQDGGPRSIVFQQAFQAKWKHGIGIVCGNDGRIERIAIYANNTMPTIEQ